MLHNAPASVSWLVSHCFMSGAVKLTGEYHENGGNSDLCAEAVVSRLHCSMSSRNLKALHAHKATSFRSCLHHRKTVEKIRLPRWNLERSIKSPGKKQEEAQVLHKSIFQDGLADFGNIRTVLLANRQQRQF